jgi:Zn-finger nucleic acid-binding protein
MRTVDRLGVHIDQCEGCRGIFLDRGELEQIAVAEQRHYTAAPPQQYQAGPPPGYPPAAAPYPAPTPYPPQPAYGRAGYRDSPSGYRDSPPGYGHRDSPPGYGHHGGHKKRRKSFLEDLFD